MDRLVARLDGLPRPLLLSIRSTFRRKGRLALTLAALTLGGAVFMTIFYVRGSLFATLADTTRYFDYDVQVQLSEPSPGVHGRGRGAAACPGTVAAEPWRFASAIRQRPDGTESPSLVVFGLPADTDTVQPIVQEGRWLLPGEGNALVATSNIRRDDPDVRGRRRRSRFGSRGRDATVDGCRHRAVADHGPLPVRGHASALGRVNGGVDRAGMVMVKTERHDGPSQAETALALRAATSSRSGSAWRRRRRPAT